MLSNMFKDLLEPEFAKLSSEDLERRILQISSLREHIWQKMHSKGASLNGALNGCQSNGGSNDYIESAVLNGHHGINHSK